MWLADTLIALGCFGLALLLGVAYLARDYGILALLITCGMCAVLAIRRALPEIYVSAMVVLAVLELLLLPTMSGSPTDLLVLVAVHAAARYCSRGFGYAALAIAVLGAFGASYLWIYRSPFRPADFNPIVPMLIGGVVMAGIAAVTYALGRAQQAKQRALGAQVHALAERNRMLQYEHEQQLKLATEQERGRLAAETHDILAHSLAIIVAQADGASMVAARSPERAQQALTQIAETSREALVEVRAKVAALRRGVDPTGDLAPAKQLTEIDVLVESVARAGLAIDLHMDGDIASLPVGVSLSAYRIVQEALTNTLKHAGPRARSTVSVRRDADALSLVIEDDGRGSASGSDDEGSGLRGMRARVEQYGGVLHAGPLVGGGFSVRASIPLQRTEQST